MKGLILLGLGVAGAVVVMEFMKPKGTSLLPGGSFDPVRDCLNNPFDQRCIAYAQQQAQQASQTDWTKPENWGFKGAWDRG